MFVDQLAELHPDEQFDVLAAAVRLCEDPAGKYPLNTPLQGWNTEDVLAGDSRMIYRPGQTDGVGVIDVLCLGPRSDNKIYDMAEALVDTGLLAHGEATFLREALAVLDVVGEDAGLDGWNYRPEPAPARMRLAAVRPGRDRTNDPADIDAIFSWRAEARCGATMS